MSDRVPYFVGTRKGVDHTYWPIKTVPGYSPGINDTAVVPADLATFNRWSWRIKTFRFSGTLVGINGVTGSVSLGPVDVPMIEFVGQTSFTPVSRERRIATNQARQISLISGNYFAWNTNKGFIYALPNNNFGIFEKDLPIVNSSSFNVTRVTLKLTFMTDDFPSFPRTDTNIFDGLQFWALCDYELVYYVSGVPFNSNAHRSWRDPVSPNAGTLTIDGVPMTVWQAAVPLDFFTFSGTLTPIEYWPFKNRLGQPVYDTVTGAQINDPFA